MTDTRTRIYAISVLPVPLSICRLPSSARIPSWAVQEDFFSVSRTADELSVICPSARVPEGVQCQTDWRCLKVEGPLDFSMTGVLSDLLKPLAAAKISICAVSTYDTDYILVKRPVLAEAIRVLRSHGHEVSEAEAKE